MSLIGATFVVLGVKKTKKCLLLQVLSLSLLLPPFPPMRRISTAPSWRSAKKTAMGNKPHISQLTLDHAIQAASFAGFETAESVSTKYGYVLYDHYAISRFCFVVKVPVDIRFGYHDRMTPNIWEVVRYLETHYTFDQ